MKTLTIARRELGAYFLSPVSYLVLTLFLLVQGYSFWLFLSLVSAHPGQHGAVLSYFFGGTILFWLFIMFLASVITMRLVAEERRAGTLEPLQTAPVTDGSIIVGKFLGAMGFYVSLWIPTLAYPLVLALVSPPGTHLDAGPIAAGYLGTLLVSSSSIALGLFFSSLTRNQILAAVLSFVTLVLLLLVGALGETLLHGSRWQHLFEYIDLFRHMEEFGRGIVDSRRIVYHLGIVVVALFAATRALEWRRGR
jgi:ABC-2 type transport system permease protein